ncbi:SHOCT domain-containing protein [Streptomyces sp. NPDC048696]|uniref:SHOCT domain-containing protein n=1 Tax=Streptomyces sp. NPDC048696 TaxID=3365585 RepID=UPI0037104608
MFIRSTRAVVRPVTRPPGAPLLRGLLENAPRPPRPEPPAPAPGAPPEAAPGAPDPDGAALVDRLTQLGRLAKEGLLTPEEFTAAKAKLLGK